MAMSIVELTVRDLLPYLKHNAGCIYGANLGRSFLGKGDIIWRNCNCGLLAALRNREVDLLGTMEKDKV